MYPIHREEYIILELHIQSLSKHNNTITLNMTIKHSLNAYLTSTIKPSNKCRNNTHYYSQLNCSTLHSFNASNCAFKSPNSILANVLEQAHSTEPREMLQTLCSNEHTSKSTSVCYYLVTLFEQPTSYVLPCSRHGSSPFVEPFVALVEASLLSLMHPTYSTFNTLNSLALSSLLTT